MTTSTKTYASKSGARKAAKRAGIADDLIEITVDGERFGFKEQEPVTTVKDKPAPAKTERVKQNGVTRPKAGGLCAAVWAWLDAHPGATAKQVREAAPEQDWNVNNAVCEFYAWRKFNGISGRVKAA